MYTAFRTAILASVLMLWSRAAAGANLEANPYFSNIDELTEFLEDSSGLDEPFTNSTLGPDSLAVEPAPDHAWRISLLGVYRVMLKDGTRPSEPVSISMDYSAVERRVVGGTGHIAGIIFCKGITYLARDTRPCYGRPELSADQQGRASFIAQHYLAKRLPGLLLDLHSEALSAYRKGHKKEAARLVQHFTDSYPWLIVPVSPDTVETYNDLGFLLAEGGRFKEGVQVLLEVTKAVPDRAVAYLNLGDAYLGMSDVDHAREAFQAYQKLMKADGKGARVPKRIQKYLDQ